MTNKCTINDLDVLGDISLTRSSASFANPVYLYEPPRVSKPQPGPVVKAGSQEITNGKAPGQGSSQAKEEKDGNANGVQS